MDVQMARTAADPSLRAELRLTPNAVAVVLLLLGVVTSLTCDMANEALVRLRLQLLTLLVFAAAGGTWMCERWRREAGRWFLVAALVGLVALCVYWLPDSGAVAMLGLPVVLGVALTGPLGGAGAAAAETALVLGLWGSRAAPMPGLWLPLLAVWGTLAATVAASYPADRLAQWLAAYFGRVQTLVE